MGRKRKRAFEQLPKGVYAQRKRLVYIEFINGVRQKSITLCSIDTPIAKVWEIFHATTTENKTKLEYLVNFYIANNVDKPSRQTIDALTRLLELKIGGSTFGKVEYEKITKGTIRKYLDFRNNVSGNREITYLSSAWNWCSERDMCGVNPCKGVRKIKESPRKRYVSDYEYNFIYKIAPKYVQVAMELAFRLRLRKSEVLDLRVKDLEEKGINTRRLKGSNNTLTLWSDELHAAVNYGLSGCLRVPDMPIVNNGKGGKVTVTAFNSAWARLKKKMPFEHFNYHDLKAKGVSDFEGDKQLASGHKDAKMVAIYDRKRNEVKPT